MLNLDTFHFPMGLLNVLALLDIECMLSTEEVSQEEMSPLTCSRSVSQASTIVMLHTHSALSVYSLLDETSRPGRDPAEKQKVTRFYRLHLFVGMR